MDITTLAAWGEFLGGIAVVVSLVYVGRPDSEQHEDRSRVELR